MKITIVYQSRRGKTAFYAREMAMFLWQQGVNVSLCATSDFTQEKLVNCDCLMLGCWTSGWFIVNQHPNDIWIEFAQKHLQGSLPSHLLLFTTYKVRTGRLFKRMQHELNLSNVTSVSTMQSKTGFLSDADKTLLKGLVNQLK